jgi:hypothetical protein
MKLLKAGGLVVVSWFFGECLDGEIGISSAIYSVLVSLDHEVLST